MGVVGHGIRKRYVFLAALRYHVELEFAGMPEDVGHLLGLFPDPESHLGRAAPKYENVCFTYVYLIFDAFDPS